MNDAHLDPPEQTEPPSCCGDYMGDVTVAGGPVTFRCDRCGRTMVEQPTEAPIDVGGEGFPDAGPPPGPCPHGVAPGNDCNECNVASDLAFDAARERSTR